MWGVSPKNSVVYTSLTQQKGEAMDGTNTRAKPVDR